MSHDQMSPMNFISVEEEATQGTWIPVAEGFPAPDSCMRPEFGGEDQYIGSPLVLGYGPSLGGQGYALVRLERRKQGDKHVWTWETDSNTFGSRLEEVTHWMRLPDKPEGEQ